MQDVENLTGKLLIAMPGMMDPRFAHTVILLCAHSDEGAMGLILNKPAQELKLDDLLKQLSIAPIAGAEGTPVYFGGPVETGRGFVLHSEAYRSALSSMVVEPFFAMTATQDILEDIGAGTGPDKFIAALGYSGWGPGQLESEIVQNGWLIAEGTEALVLDTPPSEIWRAALGQLGVDPMTLSASAGHA